jgi:hypothetical protein
LVWARARELQTGDQRNGEMEEEKTIEKLQKFFFRYFEK